MKAFLFAIIAVVFWLDVFGQSLKVDGLPFASCSMCMECPYDNNGRQCSRIIITSNLLMEQLDVKGAIVVHQKNEIGRKIIDFLPNRGQKITFYTAQCQPLEIVVSEFVTGGAEYQLHIVYDKNTPSINQSNLVPEQQTLSSNQTFTVNGVTFKMIYVKGGTFRMGATFEQGNNFFPDEKPVHEVMLNEFYIGETEVTQALWKVVMGDNPSYFDKGDNYPVDQVSYSKIVNEFLPKLNELTGKNFRLPTEAEWEYAARGGEKSKGYKYSGSNNLASVAWYGYGYEYCVIKDKNRTAIDFTSMPIKLKKPNELGIYDMSGNVWEWCQDYYAQDYYAKSTVNNPNNTTPNYTKNDNILSPLAPGPYRVLRGGSWFKLANSCRLSLRGYENEDVKDQDYGFRLALDL